MCGIDPGLATGGMVLLGPGGDVLDVHSLGVRKGRAGSVGDEHADAQFTEAVLRANVYVPSALAKLAEWEPDHVAMETFTDQESRAKRRNSKGQVQFDRNRWMTPLVIGVMLPGLEDLGFDMGSGRLHLQNPAILHQFRDEIGLYDHRLKQGKGPLRQLLSAGDEQLTSEHLVRAWCHGTYRQIRLRTRAAV